MNLDVPIEGKVKQRSRYTNAVGRVVARFEPLHERTFDLGDPGRRSLTEFLHLGVQSGLIVFVVRVVHGPPCFLFQRPLNHRRHPVL